MKRVCFVTDNDINITGGEQRVLSRVLNALVKDYSVFLVCRNGLSPNCPFDFSSDIHIIPLNQCPPAGNGSITAKVLRKINLYSGIFEKLKMKRIIQLLEFPDDLVDQWVQYLNSQHFDTVIGLSKWFGQLMMICGNRIDAKVITWFHSNYDRYYETPGEYAYGEKLLLEKAKDNIDSLVVLTKKDEEVYKELYGIHAKNIYNPLSFESTEKSSLDHQRLLFLGRMIWKLKGLDYLLEVLDRIFSKDDTWTVDLVGDGESFAKLKKEVDKKPWKDRVRIYGDTNDVVSRYLEADILLLTSRHEGFGLVVTEAMECGLPVVSFHTAGPSEILEDGKNGFLIEKYDVDLFAERVYQLMQDASLRKEMGQNASIRAKRFSQECIKKEWDEIL